MTRLLTAALFALVAGAALAGDDKPRPDADAKVAEGAEVSLTPAEITPDKDQPDQGPRAVTAKAGKAEKVKMPARAYKLGFTGEPQTGGGIKVVSLASPSALVGLRTEAGGEGAGPISAEPGDVITHANGYAVGTLEELLVAVSTAKKPEDVQLVVKDVNSGKSVMLYATAIKR
jgi:S1-C subfamily serine protease